MHLFENHQKGIISDAEFWEKLFHIFLNFHRVVEIYEKSQFSVKMYDEEEYKTRLY